MHTQTRHRSTLALQALVITVGLAVVFGLLPALAAASPTEPTLGLAALRVRLDAAAGAPIPGYLKTVLRGSTIETIPVDVLELVASSPSDAGADHLILFAAKGPKIDAIGGIASGMSGSPIYISDGGVDKLIGALSYGDSFTLGGMGLATPIEAMAKIETDYGVSVTSLPIDHPVGAADAVTITSDSETAHFLTSRGEIVVRPLEAMQVGGLPSRSPAFQALRARMQQHGVELISAATLVGSGSDYSAPLTAGSSVAVMAARGDFWYGAIGTVTYANPSSVVAFGHPLFWNGASGLAMTNAWVDGVWPSANAAYKLAVPSALRGTLLQDRAAGVLGQPGVMPVETPITVHVTDLDRGRTASSTAWMPRVAIDSASWDYQGIAQMAVYAGTIKLFDSYAIPGSAVSTTTLEVSDGSVTYTLQRRSILDSADDVAVECVNDVSQMVSAFQSVNANGLAHADILSVDVASEITTRRNWAQIADVQVPDGLTWGENTVRVSYFQFGVAATQTVDTLVTIPEEAELPGGQLIAYAMPSGSSDASFIELLSMSGSPTMDRRSVAAVVDDLRASPSASDIHVEFLPAGSPLSGFYSLGTDAFDGVSSLDALAPGMTLPYGSEPVTATIATEAFVTGSYAKQAIDLSTHVSASKVAYDGAVTVSGLITGLQGASGEVTITGRRAGSATETVLVTLTPTRYGRYASFAARIGHFKHTTDLTVRYAGDPLTLTAVSEQRVSVAARVRLRVSNTRVRRGTAVTLSASVAPADAGGSVVFEYWGARRWNTIASRALSDTGAASTSWRVPRGATSVRARYRGGAAVAGASSAVAVITGR